MKLFLYISVLVYFIFAIYAVVMIFVDGTFDALLALIGFTVVFSPVWLVVFLFLLAGSWLIKGLNYEA